MADEKGAGTGGMDRRQFVKAAAGVAGLGALGASGLAMSRGIVHLGETRRRTVSYLGLRRTRDSPAPRGIPLIPVRVNDEGLVEGVPDRLDWYRYCGHETTPGLLPSYAGDNALRYFRSADEAEKLVGTALAFWWFPAKQRLPMRADELAARPVGEAVPFIWRSEGVLPIDLVTGLLLRIDPDALRGNGLDEAMPLIDAEHGLMAVSTYCTHVCCIPGYRERAGTLKARGPWEYIHCTCHGSLFDPTAIDKYEFELVEPVPPPGDGDA